MRGRTAAIGRLRSTRDFREIYAARNSVRNRLLTVYYRPSPAGTSRLGLSVGRRLGGAVRRNRIKRLLREAAHRFAADLPEPVDLVVIPHPGRDDVVDHGAIMRAFEEAILVIARCLSEQAG